jgi:hypothetical protein
MATREVTFLLLSGIELRSFNPELGNLVTELSKLKRWTVSMSNGKSKLSRDLRRAALKVVAFVKE